MVKKEYVEVEQFRIIYIFGSLFLLFLVALILYNDFRIDKLQENIQYERVCNDVTVKGFINYSDIEHDCYDFSMLSPDGNYTYERTYCTGAELINGRVVHDDEYYCDGEECYYSYQEEVCEIREITQISGGAKNE